MSAIDKALAEYTHPDDETRRNLWRAEVTSGQRDLERAEAAVIRAKDRIVKARGRIRVARENLAALKVES